MFSALLPKPVYLIPGGPTYDGPGAVSIAHSPTNKHRVQGTGGVRPRVPLHRGGAWGEPQST